MDTTSKIMGTNVRILPLLCSSLLYFAFNIADIIWPHFIGLSQEAEKEQWGQNRNKVVFKLLSLKLLPITDIDTYRKVASSRLSRTFKDFQNVYEGKIWCLCTVTFDQKISKLNSRSVYCSRLYSMSDNLFWGAEKMFFFTSENHFLIPQKANHQG